MTTNIFSVLNTGRVSLLAQQLALEVTGQNVANAQTEGYSRQQVTFEANSPRQTAQGPLGTGVTVSGIERFHDSFLFKQILSEGDRTGNYQVRKDVFDQLEILFNENSGGSLNAELSSMFTSMQDLATNPSGLPERSNAIARGQELSHMFNSIGDELFSIQRNLDLVLEDEITQINTLSTEISNLNRAIHQSEPGNAKANDLRDSRDRLIQKLSEKIDIQQVDEVEGLISITLSGGTPLVLRDITFPISTQLNGNNNAFRDVVISNGAGSTTNITSGIQGGRLKGIIDMRDVEVAGVKDELDRLAASLVREINKLHQQGFGLDGSTGNNFFTPLTPSVKTNVNNTGAATVSAVNASPSTTSIDKYEITFTGSNSFTLQNLTTSASSGTFTFTAGSAFNLVGGMAVTISGSAAVGDKFKISLSENASRNMSVSTDVSTNSQKVAAGSSSNGNGANAQALANLQESLLFNG